MQWWSAARDLVLALVEQTRTHAPEAPVTGEPTPSTLGPDPQTPPRPLLITATADEPQKLRGTSWLLDLQAGSPRTLREATWHLDAADLARLEPATWLAAPLVVLDGFAATIAAAAGLPRRPRLVVVASTTSAWAAATELTEGPATVVTMPANAGWLLNHVLSLVATSTTTPEDKDSSTDRHVTHPVSS